MRRPLVLRIRIPKSDDEPHSPLSSRWLAASCRASQLAALLLLFALFGFFRLGFGLGAFFALDFFLALLNDFGLYGRGSIRGDGFDRFLFFDLESDDVSQDAFGIGD